MPLTYNQVKAELAAASALTGGKFVAFDAEWYVRTYQNTPIVFENAGLDQDRGLAHFSGDPLDHYVQYGAADLGIAGKDVLMEHGGQGLYQPLDLCIARCRMMVAVRAGFDYEAAIRRGARIRVATKYVKTAREHFASKGMHVDLIKLYGSMELAPLVGLADAIVDLVSTGATLKANDLVAVELIDDISSRLIVNQAALKLKHDALQPVIEAFERAVRSGDGKTRRKDAP